jgi:RimJ/RimL family protein N-acetyltransferase
MKDWVLLRLAKEFLDLKLVYLFVFANNKRARYFYRKVGFRDCGRIPKAILYKGKYVDQVFMYVDLEEWSS